MSITRPVFTTANEIKAQIDLRSKLAGHYCVAARPKNQGSAAAPPYQNTIVVKFFLMTHRFVA
jgi:hypothetical protein